jgi:hypothetical protein
MEEGAILGCGEDGEERRGEMMEKRERTWDRNSPYNCSRSQCARVVNGKGSHEWAWGKVQTNFGTMKMESGGFSFLFSTTRGPHAARHEA